MLLPIWAESRFAFYCRLIARLDFDLFPVSTVCLVMLKYYKELQIE
jgi:hypothetical protein